MKTAEPIVTRKYRALHLLALCLVLSAPVAYLIYLFMYAVNVPFWDDIDVILGNLGEHYMGAPLRQRLETVFLRHGNEHLTTTLQLYALGENAIFGEVNFRRMILVGNVFLFVFAGFLLGTARRPGEKLVFLLPVIPLLFHLHYFEATYWGTVAMQIFPAALFALLSFYFLLRASPRNLFLAMLFSFLTLITFGSGLVLLPLMALVLLLQRRFKHLLIFAGFVGLMLLLFFIQYPKMPHQGSKLDAFLVYPLDTLRFFLTLAGTGTPINRHLYWIPGALLALWFVWLSIRRYWKKNAIVYLFLLFTWLVIAAGAVSRAGGGLGEAFASRYAFNGSLLLVGSWIGFMDLLRPRLKPAMAVLGIFLSLLVCKMHFSNDLPTVEADFIRRVESIKHYSPTGESLLYSVASIGAPKMNRAIEMGFYEAPDLSPRLWQKPEILTPPVKEDTSFKCIFSYREMLLYSFVVEGRIERTLDQPGIVAVYVWLRGGENPLRLRADIREHCSEGETDVYLFECLTDFRQTKGLIYSAGIEIQDAGGGSALRWTHEPIVTGNVLNTAVPMPRLKADTIEGIITVRGEIPAYFIHDKTYLLLTSHNKGRVIPCTYRGTAGTEAFTCFADGGTQVLYIKSEEGSTPQDNYTVSFRVSPDPNVRLDSLTEISPSPENAGQKVCYTSFYDVLSENTLSLSVASNGIVLRYEDRGLYRILGYYSGAVKTNSQITLVLENQTPIVYLNGKLLFHPDTPLPQKHPFAPNFGKNSRHGFTGTLDEIRVWSVPLKPLPDGSMPEAEDSLYVKVDFDHLQEGQRGAPATSRFPGWEMVPPFSTAVSVFTARVPQDLQPGRYMAKAVFTDAKDNVLLISPSEMVLEVK